MKISTSTTGPGIPPTKPDTNKQDFDKLFLGRVLSEIWPTQSNNSFSGGIGEDHFKSFLLEQYSGILSKSMKLNIMDMK